MLCAKKTILIEKNTTILQSMFVISKTIDTIDDLWLKRKQGLEWGILLLNFHSFSHFPPALFSLFSWIPFFCFPSTLVQSLLEGKKWKKWRGREEGFFPLSPYSHPLDVFSCSLFFAPPPVVFNRLLSGARRLVWFKGTELRPLYCFPYLKFNWSNNFEINNRCKKFEQLLVC